MVRRSARFSTPRSGKGTDGRKAGWNGKFWTVLEGMDSEACGHALMAAEVSSEEPEQNLLCDDGACESSLGSERFAFAYDLVLCKPFSSGFSSQLDSSPSRHLDLSLCEFKQARKIVPPQLGKGRCNSNGSPNAASMNDLVTGSAVVNSYELDISGDVFAMECRNFNAPLISAIDFVLDGKCVKPIDASIHGISHSANCTSSVCLNASTNSACLDNQTASPQQPFKLPFGFQPGQESPNAWNRSEVYKIDDVSKATVMSENNSTVTLNMEYVHANLARLERGLVGKLFGRILPFFVLNNELKRKWSIFG